MTDFKKGDVVKASWGGEPQTVEHVSTDGKYLWLMDSDGEYSTYAADRWTVVPKFFEAGRMYTNVNGSEIHIHAVHTAKVGGSPIALGENLGSGDCFTLHPEHTMYYKM